MIIESNKGLVKRPVNEVFDYLCDMNNFKNLLPEDKISNWKADEKQCSFKVQGTTTISFIRDTETRPNKIHIVSGENSPFSFFLDIHLNEEGNTTVGYQVFNADVNMFMKMMVEKPLSHLINTMVSRLETELN